MIRYRIKRFAVSSNMIQVNPSEVSDFTRKLDVVEKQVGATTQAKIN